jgi:hypothetical protein
MELVQSSDISFDFHALQREILFVRYKFLSFKLFGLKRKAVRKAKAFYRSIQARIDAIMSIDLSSIRGAEALQIIPVATEAGETLIKLSDLHSALAEVKFFGSDDLRKIAEAQLDRFFKMERKLRDAAFAGADAVADDCKLAEFNSILSSNLYNSATKI